MIKKKINYRNISRIFIFLGISMLLFTFFVKNNRDEYTAKLEQVKTEQYKIAETIYNDNKILENQKDSLENLLKNSYIVNGNLNDSISELLLSIKSLNKDKDSLKLETLNKNLTFENYKKGDYTYWFVNYQKYEKKKGEKEAELSKKGMSVVKIKHPTFNPILAAKQFSGIGDYKKTGNWVFFSLIKQISEYDYNLYNKTY